MRRVSAVLHFVWDFVIGDDWRIAAGVVVALGATSLASNQSSSVWWILPAAVSVLLAMSVFAAARRR